MEQIDLAVIGGTGLYDIEGLTVLRKVRPKTPFGLPSDEITVGKLEGRTVAFLPRHGRGHRLLPSEIPFQANVYALKLLGVTRVLSISSVGSLSDDLGPMDIAVPDQIIDKTKGRPFTFFGEGIVAHVAFSHPVCPDLSSLTAEAARDVVGVVKEGGTYLCMEGPAFSTKAESLLHRSWGASVIGMTAVPEAKLMREAEMCYGLLSLVTDYDAWHETAEAVTTEMILGYLKKNSENAKKIIRTILSRLPEKRSCACGEALGIALVTNLTNAPKKTVEKLHPILAKYL